MGMDVYGKKPKSKDGEYFRNNVWWWRPLWDYCCKIHPACEIVSGHYNDGDGFSNSGALKLADSLDGALESGAVADYAKSFEEQRAAIPDEECDICHGTGTRKDMVVDKGCNKCLGKGKVRPYVALYPFSEENVREFAKFVPESGGCEIR